MLSRTKQNEVADAVADLVTAFERCRVDCVAVTSDSDYHVAYRQAVVARQLVASFRAAPHVTHGLKPDFRDLMMARDSAMADNVRWAVEREGVQGRIFVFAHNWHIKKSDSLTPPYPEYPYSSPPTSMGQYLAAIFNGAMIALGSTAGRGEDALKLPPTEARGVDARLAQVGLPLFLLDLRKAPGAGPVMDWLNRPQPIRVNDRFADLNPLQAFDVLMFVDSVTSVHVMH